MRLFLVLALLCVTPLISYAKSPVWEENATDISIYVQARDGTFIGTAMGGAYISVKDKRTGDILAEGTTYGSTGDTDAIMAPSRKRGDILVDDDTASFAFSLDIMEPTMVTISATAPLAQPQSTTTVTEDILLIPSKDYSSGNGIIIDMPGMVVDVLAPMVNKKMPFNPEKPITIAAAVTKLCGCTIAEGTHWPPEHYEVEAHIYKDTIPITSIPMKSMGNSQYAANLKIPLPGTYSITVTAFDKETKEGGFDKTTIVLEQTEKTTEEKNNDAKQ